MPSADDDWQHGHSPIGSPPPAQSRRLSARPRVISPKDKRRCRSERVSMTVIVFSRTSTRRFASRQKRQMTTNSSRIERCRIRDARCFVFSRVPLMRQSRCRRQRKKAAPTNRGRARSRSIEPSASHHNRTPLESTSIIESARIIKATLPASIPDRNADHPLPATAQVILMYSTRRPARVCMTDQLLGHDGFSARANLIRLSCRAVSKNLRPRAVSAEWVTGRFGATHRHLWISQLSRKFY